MKKFILPAATLLAILPAAAHATAVAGNIRVLPTAEGATVRLALSEPLAAPPRAFATEQRQGDKQQEDGDGQPAS